MKHKWVQHKSNSLPNLNVLNIDGLEKGFIWKPKDTKTDKNAWRIHTGIGDDEHFLCHSWDKKLAKMALEKLLLVTDKSS